MLEFLKRPGFLGTYGTMGADLSFSMALVFTILFIIGWQMGKKMKGNSHHTLVLWAMISMMLYFTVYYLARGLGALATEGKEGFGGPEWLYSYLFKPLLTIHILVVSVGLVLAVYMIVLGFRVAVKRMGQRVLQVGVLKMSQAAFLKITVATLVLLGLIGVARCHTLPCWIVYISGFLLVVVVLLAEKGIERLIPDGERRHRMIGTFTMTLYVIALFTSTITYVLLYIIYPPKHM
ncbi:MAG: DUF420 domain-containing protein [Nitrospiria bacterium]